MPSSQKQTTWRHQRCVPSRKSRCQWGRVPQQIRPLPYQPARTQTRHPGRSKAHHCPPGPGCQRKGHKQPWLSEGARLLIVQRWGPSQCLETHECSPTDSLQSCWQVIHDGWMMSTSAEVLQQLMGLLQQIGVQSTGVAGLLQMV